MFSRIIIAKRVILSPLSCHWNISNIGNWFLEVLVLVKTWGRNTWAHTHTQSWPVALQDWSQLLTNVSLWVCAVEFGPLTGRLIQQWGTEKGLLFCVCVFMFSCIHAYRFVSYYLLLRKLLLYFGYCMKPIQLLSLFICNLRLKKSVETSCENLRNIWCPQLLIYFPREFIFSSRLTEQNDMIMAHVCKWMHGFLFKLSSMSGFSAGLGAAESSQGCQRGAGLRQGLPELYLWVHLQQLPGALQPPVPAHYPTGELWRINTFKLLHSIWMREMSMKTW